MAATQHTDEEKPQIPRSACLCEDRQAHHEGETRPAEKSLEKARFATRKTRGDAKPPLLLFWGCSEVSAEALAAAARSLFVRVRDSESRALQAVILKVQFSTREVGEGLWVYQDSHTLSLRHDIVL